MRVDFAGGDYHIYFEQTELGKLIKPISTLGGFRYNSLVVKIIDSEDPGSYVIVAPSNDHSVARAPEGIKYSLSEDEHTDPIFEVFTPRLHDLLEGKERFLMSRYNTMDKVWFFLQEDTVPTPLIQ